MPLPRKDSLSDDDSGSMKDGDNGNKAAKAAPPGAGVSDSPPPYRPTRKDSLSDDDASLPPPETKAASKAMPAAAAASLRPPVVGKRKDSVGSDIDSEHHPEMKDIIRDIEKERKAVEYRGPTTRAGFIRREIAEWSAHCSCHGIPHLTAVATIFAALVWTVIIICCAIAFVYLVTTTIRQYLAFSVIINLREEMFPSSDFPSVSFCNLNPFKRSEISAVDDLNALMELYKSADDYLD